MNNAIQNNLNWQSGNTSVHFNEEDSVSVVRLHGNKIAEVGDTFIRLFDGGWQTNTTKSRLNAILQEHGESGDKVFQKNFDWFVSMNTAQGISTVPFFNSMRLGWYPVSFFAFSLTLMTRPLKYREPAWTDSNMGIFKLLSLMVNIVGVNWYKRCGRQTSCLSGTTPTPKRLTLCL